MFKTTMSRMRVTSSSSWHAGRALLLLARHAATGAPAIVWEGYGGGRQVPRDVCAQLEELFSWVSLSTRELHVQGGTVHEMRAFVDALPLPDDVRLLCPSGRDTFVDHGTPRTFGSAFAVWGIYNAEEQYWEYRDGCFLHVVECAGPSDDDQVQQQSATIPDTPEAMAAAEYDMCAHAPNWHYLTFFWRR